MGNDANNNEAREIEKKDQEPLPDVLPPELANRIPQDVRREVIAFFLRSGPAPSPLARVIKSEHVDKILINAEQDADRSYKFACSGRRYGFAVFIISIIVTGLLVYGFSDKPQVFTPILTAVLGFGAGFGVSKRG